MAALPAFSHPLLSSCGLHSGRTTPPNRIGFTPSVLSAPVSWSLTTCALLQFMFVLPAPPWPPLSALGLFSLLQCEGSLELPGHGHLDRRLVHSHHCDFALRELPGPHKEASRAVRSPCSKSAHVLVCGLCHPVESDGSTHRSPPPDRPPRHPEDVAPCSRGVNAMGQLHRTPALTGP